MASHQGRKGTNAPGTGEEIVVVIRDNKRRFVSSHPYQVSILNIAA